LTDRYGINYKACREPIPAARSKKMAREKREVSKMTIFNKISCFFHTDTYTVDRGYIIHVSRAPEFATQAVVEDADGKQALIDVAEVPYEDFEDFLDAVLEKYEQTWQV
jgi:hypothetical protein